MTDDNQMSAPPVFGPATLADFAAAYPDRTARLKHGLVGHPLLSRDVLADLAARMRPRDVEYNLGDVPLGLRPEDAPANGLTIAETVRTIGENGSWCVLKNVERMPGYAQMLDSALAPLVPLVAQKTGEMAHRECFIFVTSPNSVTPFHMDPEHNILLQIEGDKTMVTFPTGDGDLVPAEKSESFHLGGHRNLTWRDEFEAKATHELLHPGDAILMPVKTPHYVRNMDNISVSMSVTWRSERSVAESELHALNARLRGRRLPLVAITPQPERQTIARLGWRIARRIGL